MSRGSFVIYSTNQELNISVDQITGSGGADAPNLLVPIKIDFNALRRGSYSEKGQAFEAMSIKATLLATEKSFKISENIQFLRTKVNDKDSSYVQFQFPLSLEIINRIEKARKGNLPFHLQFEVQIATYDNFTVTNTKAERSDKSFITGFETGQGNVQFIIEQSQWVNKVLGKLGHNSYKLVEIPAINQIIPDEYKTSLAEFEEAQRFFLNGDYDKTVAHCRAALDPFSGKSNLPKLKEFVKSKSEFEWATSVLDATEVWLEKVIKATSSFTSKTHHAPSIGHFSRTEAEIVLMITTGIIAYIGKIEYKPQ
jgi:hypothetical protein